MPPHPVFGTVTYATVGWVDLEAGYGRSPSELNAGPLDTGTIGLNVEDTVHCQGGRMRSSDEPAAVRDDAIT